MNEREAAMSHPPRAELMIVTGMSGAGRSTAANVLEDQGWYVVDNLPPQLLPDLAGLGPAKQKALLAHFGSLKRIRAADADALCEVKGIGPTLAETIVRSLGQEQSEPAVNVMTGEIVE